MIRTIRTILVILVILMIPRRHWIRFLVHAATAHWDELRHGYTVPVLVLLSQANYDTHDNTHDNKNGKCD